MGKSRRIMQKVRTPVLIQRLPARFNAGQVRAIMQELQPFLKADRPRVVFDLSQVEEMDAASVDMLLQCMSDASKRDGDVKLASPSVRAMVILELTHLDCLLEFFESPAKPSAVFGGPFTDSQAQPANTQPNASAPSAPAQEDSRPQANPLPAQNSQQPPDPTPAQNTPQQSEDQKKTPDQQQPAGAAAAQLGRTTGGAASKPAGAAMAPAKQRQSRSLLLKMGLLAAAGVAVGTVVGLTKATPSKPPGAH